VFLRITRKQLDLQSIGGWIAYALLHLLRGGAPRMD
jgi:hypothetical protein